MLDDNIALLPLHFWTGRVLTRIHDRHLERVLIAQSVIVILSQKMVIMPVGLGIFSHRIFAFPTLKAEQMKDIEIMRFVKLWQTLIEAGSVIVIIGTLWRPPLLLWLPWRPWRHRVTAPRPRHVVLEQRPLLDVHLVEGWPLAAEVILVARATSEQQKIFATRASWKATPEIIRATVPY